MTALPPPFAWEDDHVVADLPRARVLFTTRRGGVSEGPFASLNLSTQTGDDPERVRRNRERVAGLLGLPWERVRHARQVHGTVVATGAASGPVGTGPDPPAEADGQATTRADAAALVLVADCLPIALAGDGGVAMLHGGWRGLAGGIVAAGVRALRDLGVKEPLAAAVGPGARGCCYEVGDEVRAAFAALGPGVVSGRHLDLSAVARALLARAGVDAVHDTGLCTMCADPGLFFSHRRDRGVTGRQAGAVRRS